MSQITATYVNHMGTDQSIINAARVSFNKDSFKGESRTEEQDISLLNYLARGCSSTIWKDDLLTLEHGTDDAETAAALLKEIRTRPTHWSAFAHTAITIVCSAPVSIRTQAFKHQVGLTANEESRRYICTKPVIYVPEFRSRPVGSIKQGSGLKHHATGYWAKRYQQQCDAALDLYECMISDGVSPEQARFVLPQGTIVNWVWTGNLYAFANFYIARSDPHAQKEIQELAEQINLILRPLFPKAWAALIDQ